MKNNARLISDNNTEDAANSALFDFNQEIYVKNILIFQRLKNVLHWDVGDSTIDIFEYDPDFINCLNTYSKTAK